MSCSTAAPRAAGTLDLNGFDQTLNGLVGDRANAVLGQVVNNGGGSHTLTVGDQDVSSVFDGLIKDNTNGSGGTVTLVKTGNGTFFLGGANTFSGATNIHAGSLIVSAVATGTAPQPLGENQYVGLGTSTSSGVLVYASTADGTLDKNINSNGTGGDTIGNLGSGSLTLTGAITVGFAGGINFSDNGSGIIVSGTILWDGGAVQPVTVLGGNVTFSGANTYYGLTNINSGTLSINTSATGSGDQSLGEGRHREPRCGQHLLRHPELHRHRRHSG